MPKLLSGRPAECLVHLARKAATNLNIRWNKRTYVFELVESDAPVLALNLEDRAASEIVQPAPQVTPTRLLALLDKAKAFPLLKKQQPDAVAGAEARAFGDKPQITDFNDYEIRIEEVFRFNPEDTLVFHVTLRNKGLGSQARPPPQAAAPAVVARISGQKCNFDLEAKVGIERESQFRLLRYYRLTTRGTLPHN